MIIAALSPALAAGAAEPSRGQNQAATSAIPGRQQLIDILGVLRRRQRRVDLALPRIARSVYADLSLARRATVTPWGQKVFLVPMKPFAGGPKLETLGLYFGYGGAEGATASAIEAHGEWMFQVAGSRRGRESRSQVVGVVPDRVVKVAFHLRAADHFPSLTVTRSARHNIVAMQINRPGPDGVLPLKMTWYGARGRVISRIG